MSCSVLSKDKISNKEYLELMIKHHINTVRMCDIVSFTSNNDFILDYARRIKSNQNNEIFFMKKFFNFLPNIQNDDPSCGCERNVLGSEISNAYPGIFDGSYCNESDFATLPPLNQIINSENVSGMCNNNVKINEKMSDCEFVDKMFLHFKSAIELSKLLIKSTKEPRLFALAQTIITNEEKDMFEITFLKNNLYNWKNLIPNKFYSL
jgi:uncharacterized protein (DUF305 family)